MYKYIDVYLPDYSQGRPLSVDVTISHPSQTTTTQHARGEVSASEQAAIDKFLLKENLYSNLCAVNGVDFLAVPICAYGGCLASSDELFGTLAGRVAERTGLPKSVASTQLLQRLSVVLWRGNAKMVLHKQPATTGHWTVLAQMRS